MGCHVDSQKQSKLNDSESLDTENSESLSDEGLNNKVSGQNVQKIIDAITKTLMPLASDKDKAFDLVKEFPDNGMAYGHLAHSLYISGGEKEKSIELYKRCLDFDRESQFCKEGYAALLDE